jgi:hypothetical protein
MTMRVALGVALVCASAFAAQAEPMWKGPAWYVVADTIVGAFVWQGPYASKEACDAARPANEEDADYVCEWLNERPSWDD